MNGKKRFIENLTEKEHRSLTKGYRTGNSPVYQRRCHCILLSSQHCTVNELSNLFSVSINTVYARPDRWGSSGIEGLKPQPGRGRKKKPNTENADHVEVVKRLVENDPQQPDRVVVHVKDEPNIGINKRTLKRFLKKSTISGNVSGTG